MSKINDGGPAFPFGQISEITGQPINGYFDPGMTLRDWFATYATDADIAAIQNPPHGAQNITRWAARYLHADAMLRAREVKP
jgi:hypothetical protein